MHSYWWAQSEFIPSMSVYCHTDLVKSISPLSKLSASLRREESPSVNTGLVSYHFPHGNTPVLQCCISEKPSYFQWGFQSCQRRYTESGQGLQQYSVLDTELLSLFSHGKNQRHSVLNKFVPIWQFQLKHREKLGSRPTKIKHGY